MDYELITQCNKSSNPDLELYLYLHLNTAKYDNKDITLSYIRVGQ